MNQQQQVSVKAYLQNIVEGVVDKPNEIRISEVQTPNMLIVELEVAPEDVPKVVGKQGKMANSLRTLLTAYCARRGTKVHLEIVNPRKPKAR